MEKLYPRPESRKVLAILKCTVLYFGFACLYNSSFSQSLVPELVFKNAQLKTGIGCTAAGADGAVYIFSNVTPTIDAIVTIKGRSSNEVSLSNIDLVGPVEDPEKGTGYDNAWQPRVAYHGGSAPANTSWWMEFQVSFVDHINHNNPTSVNAFYVTGLDVDGDGKNLHEYLSFYQPQTYTLEQNTDINPVSVSGCLSDAVAAGKEFNGPTKNYPNITPTATDVMVTNYYTNANSFVVRIGAKTGSTASSAADRMNALWFKSFVFNLPVVTTLPISLIAFNAQLQDKDVTLRWRTAMEQDVSHFTIQRSFDGSSFDDAAVVFTEGNSSMPKDYSYADNINNISTRLLYYRLKMVDVNAKFKYSEVVIVRLSGDQLLTNVLVYPNPVANELRITIPVEWQNKIIAYNVYNSNGILVRQKINSNAGQTETLQVADLPVGIYIIKTANGNQTSVQKFIKSNS